MRAKTRSWPRGQADGNGTDALKIMLGFDRVYWAATTTATAKGTPVDVLEVFPRGVGVLATDYLSAPVKVPKSAKQWHHLVGYLHHRSKFLG
jgi:hypothetical protein